MLLLLGLEGTTQVKLLHDREADIRTQALHMAYGLETEQWRLIDDIQHIAATLVTVGAAEMLGPGCQDALDRLKSQIPAYLTVEIMAPEGKVGCATDRRAIGAFIGDRDNIRQALATGRFATGGYSTARQIGHAVLTFAQPLTKSDGSPAGAVALLLDLEWLDAYLIRNPPLAGTVMMITDRDGRILAREPPLPDEIGHPLPASLAFMLQGKHEDVIDVEWPGAGERITAYVPPPVRLPGILIAVGVDKTAALAPAREALWRSLASFGGVLALGYAFAIWSARQLIGVQESLVLALEAGRAGTSDQNLETDKWQWSAETFRIFGLDSKRHKPGFETWKAVIHPEDRRRVLKEWEAQLESRAPSLHLEYRVRHGRDEVLWVECLSRVHYTKEGRPRRINGLNIDVTARKLFEEELRISREHMRMALEAAHAGAWEWKVSNDDISWSDEVYRQRGLDPATTGKPSKELWLSTTHPEDRQAFLTEINAVFAERRPSFHIEGRVRHRDGSIRWLARTGRVFYQAQGQPERMVGLSLDITERKEAEAGLRSQKEEAERASVMKSKFLAAASHDLRQPVQSMILLAHALSAQLQEHPAAPIVGKLMDAQDSLKELLDSVLDLTKLDAGLVAPDIHGVSLPALIAPLAAAYQMRAADKGLKFRFRVCDAWIRTDPTLFSRILSNLLDNAIKYTARGGVLLTCRPAGDTLRVTVTDTGVGIARQHIGEIFQEFVQVGESGRERRQGMGLGLATVQRLAQLLGHSIGVWSRPGRGSRFTVAAPAAPPSGQPAAIPGRRTVPGAHKRILVVDDETAILDGMKAMLEQWGYAPITADTLPAALEQVAQSGQPDALVVDFRLGAGVTGVDVVTAVRNNTGRQVPAILLTGDTALRMRGDFAVLYKPVSPAELNRTLADVCAAGGRV